VLRVDQGRVEEAERLLTRALGIFETTLGADHPKTRTCQDRLAELSPR